MQEGKRFIAEPVLGAVVPVFTRTRVTFTLLAGMLRQDDVSGFAHFPPLSQETSIVPKPLIPKEAQP